MYCLVGIPCNRNPTASIREEVMLQLVVVEGGVWDRRLCKFQLLSVIDFLLLAAWMLSVTCLVVNRHYVSISKTGCLRQSITIRRKNVLLLLCCIQGFLFRAIGCRFGTTDGRCPSYNCRLVSDQQHLIIISFISLIDLLTVSYRSPAMELTLCCVKYSVLHNKFGKTVTTNSVVIT